MSIRNQNWYNLQSTRSYPLDESSAAVDDTGAFIRDDILVDCHIRFSSDLGQHLYLQGLTVSAGLITAVFGVAATLNSAGSTIASVTVVRPGNAYANYSIVPLVAGVSGWVVFGPGIDTPFVGRYTNPTQALINPRCGRAYRALPVPSIGKINLATSLQGVVTITGTNPVIAEYKLVQYDNKEMRAIVFRLDDTQLTDTYNPLEEFLPACAKRPESGTCYKQPITSINGVEPDCDGNIDIVPGEGITLTLFDDCGGMDLTTPRSLAASCAAIKPKRPEEYEDACCVSATVVGDTTVDSPTITNAQNISKVVPGLLAVGLNILKDAAVTVVDATANTITLSKSATATAVGVSLKFYKAIDAFCWPDITQTIDIIEDETTPVYPPRDLPITQNFNSCVLVPEFDIQAGSLTKTETLAPPPLGDTESPDPTALTSHFVLETTGYSTLNISTIKNGATDWAYGHTITTELKIGVNGVARNGGVVLNYAQRIVNNSRITTYIAVLIDVQRAQIVVRRYTNSAYITDTAVDFTSLPNTWYRLAATPSFDGGNNISIDFEVSELSGANSLEGTATFLNCVTPVGASEPVCQPTDGAFGIISAQSQTFFNSFTVT